MKKNEKDNVAESRAALQGVLDRLVDQTGPLLVLEAGCGSSSHVRLPEKALIVGIDISPEQLEKNTYLHKKILGDLQTHPFDPESFDLIICWDVLEHLPNPADALKSFVKGVKPNGVVLLALPNVNSVKGMVTKFTPHRFHVWFYRYVYNSKNAGKTGFAPFPTYLRSAVSPGALRRFAREQGLVQEHIHLYESRMVTRMKDRSLMLGGIYKSISGLLKILTLGTYDGTKSDVFLVFRKPISPS